MSIDSFVLTMKLPESGLDDYLTQRTRLVSAVKDALSEYLRDLKKQTKKAKAKAEKNA